MITPVNQNLSRVTARTSAPVKRNPAAPSRTPAFGKVLRNEKPSAPVSSSAAETGVKRLGPFFADTVLGPTNPRVNTPPALPAAPAVAAPYEVSGIPSGFINFTNRAMHEETMNSWLEKSTQAANDQKMQIYSQAVVNWKLNESRYRDLGLPVPPPPQPPVLDEVAPMPKGWWFEDTRA